MNKILSAIAVVVLLCLPLSAQANIIWYINSSGQSLSMGYNSCPVISTTQPYSNLSLENSETTGDFIPLVEVATGSGCETPVSGMANTITMMSGGSQIVCSTHHGVPGVPIASLNKGTTPYNDSLTAIETAKANAEAQGDTLRVLGTVWTQGESDQGKTLEEYKNLLVQLQSDYESDISAITGQTGPIPLFISQIGYWNGSSDAVALAQFQAAMDYPDRIILATPLYTLPKATDNIHLTNEGSRWLGSYFANVIWHMRGGFKWVPLAPKSLTINGATITLRCHVPTPPLVIDTTTIDEATDYGFTFTDGSGSPPAISNVSLSGDDTIIITLESVPTGGSPRVQYADYQVHYATGNIRDSENETGYMSETLYNWMPTWDLPIGYSWESSYVHNCMSQTGGASISGEIIMDCR